MACMALMYKLISGPENKEFVIGIFLDFSQAFVTVDHDILLCTLSHYGTRGNALKWIKCYLCIQNLYPSTLFVVYYRAHY